MTGTGMPGGRVPMSSIVEGEMRCGHARTALLDDCLLFLFDTHHGTNGFDGCRIVTLDAES